MPTIDQQALRSLLSDRAEALDQIAHLTAEVKQLEARISELIAPADRPVRVPGFGTLRITAPSVSQRVDPDALRQLIQSLRETGQGQLADEIAACTKPSYRDGSLRITPEKPAA
ncbi:MAG TPA: hypothetical protein VKE41_23315 [Roseiflexaceae bacterium]|nr:hypothetical protein [Roseiflexaceae bacterium]